MNLSVYFVTPDGADDGLVLAALRGGASVIQLRDKTASDAAMTAQARRLLPACRAAGVPLIVNDRLSVALHSGADGLHVGQGDGDIRTLRAALGPERILGLSIETAAQLAAMPADTVDYIGVGPVHATATKPDHAAPLGLTALARIVAASPCPAVAIGGVGLADVPALRQMGAAGLAVVSAIAGDANPEAATRRLVDAWSAA
ncbi:thiamine phosphate synthase [bacterium]|nr:thiamine phosphate synthase [bacterium]